MRAKLYLSEIKDLRDLARKVDPGEEVKVEKTRPKKKPRIKVKPVVQAAPPPPIVEVSTYEKKEEPFIPEPRREAPPEVGRPKSDSPPKERKPIDRSMLDLTDALLSAGMMPYRFWMPTGD